MTPEEAATFAKGVACDVRHVYESPLNLVGVSGGLGSLATAVEVLADAVIDLAGLLEAQRGD